jgi:nitrite reductase/ring-hydroxylating ferredoxin subunit/uncharacterized membrane protein
MNSLALVSWLDRQTWLDSTADALQPAMRRAFDALGPARRGVKNFLHGTWLGHPLHPALTDVPLGAWTGTVVLDAVGSGSADSGFSRSADLTLALGLAGALGAAVSGLTDWSDTDARPRRVGVAHALLNAGATLLFAAALVHRRRGRRAAGQGLALAGYLTAVAAAYLGGELAYHEQIGMDHSSGRALPEEFTRVLPESEVSDGVLTRAQYKETPLLLVRRGERIHALVGVCAHMGGPLCEGKLEGDTVVCPWHASRFALESGAVVDGPSAFPQPCLDARIRDGHVEVRAARS